MKSLFITFEGIDGCGKSTQIKILKERLDKIGIQTTITREPGGTPIGEKIRKILLSPQNSDMCYECEVLLYLSARAQHVHQKILPELKSGKIVLCDRFYDATIAYQGYGRNVNLKTLSLINKFATKGLIPSISFYIDIDVETAFLRIKKDNKSLDRLEQSSKDFYEKVRKGYLCLARSNKKRIMVLDGNKTIKEISELVYKTVMKRLSNKDLS